MFHFSLYLTLALCVYGGTMMIVVVVIIVSHICDAWQEWQQLLDEVTAIYTSLLINQGEYIVILESDDIVYVFAFMKN